MHKKLIIILLLVAFILPAQAQLKKKRISSTLKQYITLSVGVNHPVMELKSYHGPSVQFSYTYLFKPELGLKGFVDYNYFMGGNQYQSHFASIGAEVVCNCYIDGSERRESAGSSAVPERVYLHGGIGFSGFFCTPKPLFTDGLTALFPLGFGIAWSVAENWALGFDATYNFTATDKLDNIASGMMSDSYPALFLTLTYKFPSTKLNGTGYGYKSVKRKKCDPRKGCAITYE